MSISAFILGAANEFLFNSSNNLELQIIFEALKSNNYKKARVCIKNYFEGVIPRYTDYDFKTHFRMSRATVEVIASHLGPDLQAGTGRPQCSLEKQILITLWYLGNQETFRCLADRFNMSKSSIREIVYRILDILISKRSQFIKWPTLDEAKRTAQNFKQKNGFPNVIGCIDGSHIPIAKPSQQHDAYINRKGFHSLLLQGVCNDRRKFIDVECGYPGSMHDARVLRRTYLGQILQDNPEQVMFSSEFHLLGDSAYPLTNHIITPYRDNGNLNAIQKTFNYKLSSLRIKIEHSFGILKARFRILKYVNVKNTVNIPKIILGCCILHNFCIDAKDEFEEPEPEEEPQREGLDGDTRTGNFKRDYIASIL